MLFSSDLELFSPLVSHIRFAKAVDRKTLASLERLARRMEPALRDGFLAGIRSARSQVTLQTLEQALTALDPAAAIRAATGGLEFDRMRDTLAELVEASGARATNALRRITGEMIASFDMVNPHAVRYARIEVGNMIREISTTTMQGIQRLIAHGISEGVDVRETARHIRSMIGLTDQQANWAINYETKLLERGAVDIDGKVERYANKLLRNRAISIARTESMDSLNAGQQAAWNSAVDQGFLPQDVEQEIHVADDERLCEVCEPMPDMEENQHVKLNDVFITGDGRRVKKPPFHVRCRCTISLRL